MKPAPLAEMPSEVPPEGTVYHCIIFPAEVALRLDVPPAHVLVGNACALVGAEGRATTERVTDVLVALAQVPFHASA